MRRAQESATGDSDELRPMGELEATGEDAGPLPSQRVLTEDGLWGIASIKRTHDGGFACLHGHRKRSDGQDV